MLTFLFILFKIYIDPLRFVLVSLRVRLSIYYPCFLVRKYPTTNHQTQSQILPPLRRLTSLEEEEKKKSFTLEKGFNVGLGAAVRQTAQPQHRVVPVGGVVRRLLRVLLELLGVAAKYFDVALAHHLVVLLERLVQVLFAVHLHEGLARRPTLGVCCQIHGRFRALAVHLRYYVDALLGLRIKRSFRVDR